MKALLDRFFADERGATAIEYTLIASIVSIAIISALLQIGPLVEDNFTQAADAFEQ